MNSNKSMLMWKQNNELTIVITITIITSIHMYNMLTVSNMLTCIVNTDHIAM